MLTADGPPRSGGAAGRRGDRGPATAGSWSGRVLAALGPDAHTADWSSDGRMEPGGTPGDDSITARRLAVRLRRRHRRNLLTHWEVPARGAGDVIAGEATGRAYDLPASRALRPTLVPQGGFTARRCAVRLTEHRLSAAACRSGRGQYALKVSVVALRSGLHGPPSSSSTPTGRLSRRPFVGPYLAELLPSATRARWSGMSAGNRSGTRPSTRRQRGLAASLEDTAL